MDCQQLVNKITSRIHDVYAKHLSYAGRLQIIMASVLKEIDKKCREFLWGAFEEKRKIALVAWDKICMPKKNGGINIKGCSKWNIASVGKLLWQVASKKDILWVKWVNGIYLKSEENIWEHIPPGDCSWYWKKLNSLKTQMVDWYQGDRYKLTPTGAYSVSRSYETMLGTMPRFGEADLVWSKIMIPRQRMIVWLACQNRLLTKERLTRLNIQVDDQTCCLCDAAVIETQSHLFADCQWISGIRNTLSTWLGIPILCQGVHDTIRWIKRRRWKQFQKEIVTTIWGALIYYTWQARNWKIFKEENVNKEFVTVQIQKEVRERLGMLNCSKRARRCQVLIQRLCN
ncbi:uncharacterized protein LOC132637097 [Lycium barbarum]|uniref:uncharacterized protein LOC132637097 n=1 Tax=Lycium barbarum TaxID=112863 RepID=UPI00293F3670|nr:uncharacterized protein LOC132637097 [Lycium barbarum]